MPRDPTRPSQFDLLRPFPNVIRRIKQEEYAGCIRFGSQGVHRGKTASTEAISPMFNFRTVATLPAGVVVIDDQAASRPHHFAQLTDQDTFPCCG
jgi:hypothetical protein